MPHVVAERLVAAPSFLLDTGAHIPVITPNLAWSLSVERAPGEPRAKARVASGQAVEMSLLRVKSLAVSSTRIDNFSIAVCDLAGMARSVTPVVSIDESLEPILLNASK
jgi:hypothetical protein